MKYFKFFFFLFFLLSCNKSKTVLICGDHICVNKAEAEQYFEENLSIEVKIIDQNDKNEINLVQLNLENNMRNNKKEINIFSKRKTEKNLKILSKKEISQIKKEVKGKKNKNKKSNDLKKSNNSNINGNSENKYVKINNNNNEIIENENKLKRITIDKKRKKVVDVCTFIENCTIDEISKYLLKQGNDREFPDITMRQ